jgi:hypothetical protein
MESYLGHPCPRHVPAENSRTSCARPCGLVLRPAAASYGVKIKIKRHGKSSTVGWADKPSARLTLPPSTAGLISPAYASASIRHPGERRDPALAAALALDLALEARRWRRAAQPDVGERRLCLRPWMAELGAGRRPASSAGHRSGSIGSAPASGRLSLGYLSLATQRKVTRTPKADETGRETNTQSKIPNSHRDQSASIEIADARMNPRGCAFRRSYREPVEETRSLGWRSADRIASRS